MARKVSKASVNYRAANPFRPGRRCGTCSMFRSPASCTLVRGLIVTVGVCDRYDPKSKRG